MWLVDPSNNRPIVNKCKIPRSGHSGLVCRVEFERTVLKGLMEENVRTLCEPTILWWVSLEPSEIDPLWQ